jgi:hypothetical protein
MLQHVERLSLAALTLLGPAVVVYVVLTIRDQRPRRSYDPDRPRYWIAVLIFAVAAAGMFALSRLPECVGPNAPDCVARKEARKTCADKKHRAPGQSEEECVYSQS